MTELEKAERELFELKQKVATLRRDSEPIAVKNYSFQTPEGEVSLLELFGSKDTLFLIHNMGQGCRYCTLWADGLNGFVAHIESEFALALVSQDDPETQRRFSNSRGWRFKMASHGGGDYMKEQISFGDQKNMPGIACYMRKGSSIFKKNSAVFGPGDEFCSLWSVLGLAGVSTEQWTPQFNYWKRPETLQDGGKNLVE